ncbi:hypothetical protein IJI31_05175 [bacterium]|nr:hypothetical protein [bacterium]
MTEKIKFDPGFNQYVQSFTVNIGYIYGEFKRFKNFSQKQFQFQRFYATIRTILEKQIAFSLGCMLWAVYIKAQPTAEIEGNHNLGTEISQEDYCKETDFTINYLDQIPKDTEYYLHLAYQPPESYYKIMNKYKEFIVLNDGFVNTKTNDDVKLPELKSVSEDDLKKIKETIDEAISSGELAKMLDIADLIID